MDLPTNYGEAYREEFREMYGRVATDLSVPLLPFLLENVAMVKELNQADGIHPNVAGQQIVAQNVIKFLEPIVKGESDGLPQPVDESLSSAETEAIDTAGTAGADTGADAGTGAGGAQDDE